MLGNGHPGSPIFPLGCFGTSVWPVFIDLYVGGDMCMLTEGTVSWWAIWWPLPFGPRKDKPTTPNEGAIIWVCLF